MQEGLPNFLVCPLDRTPLVVADQQVIIRINRAIAAGRIVNRAGQLVDQPIDGGLLRSDQTLLYPVCNGIPILLVDESIPMEQLGS